MTRGPSPGRVGAPGCGRVQGHVLPRSRSWPPGPAICRRRRICRTRPAPGDLLRRLGVGGAGRESHFEEKSAERLERRRRPRAVLRPGDRFRRSAKLRADASRLLAMVADARARRLRSRYSPIRVRRWISKSLITAMGTRAPVLVQDAETEIPGGVLERLQNRYLLRLEPRFGADWLELAHDRLVGPITRSNAKHIAASNHKRVGLGLSALFLVAGGWGWRDIREAKRDRRETGARRRHEERDH